MVQVQLRIPEGLVKQIDKMVKKKIAKSRSDAIKTILALYQETQKTRKFYKMLVERSKEARENPEILIPLEDIE